MKDYSKTVATYAALAAIQKEGIKNWDDILECLESACNIVRFEIERNKPQYRIEYVNNNNDSYYQLVRIKDDAILYANSDEAQIVSYCIDNGYKNVTSI